MLLLRPKFLTLKNRLSTRGGWLNKDFAFFLFTAGVLVVIYLTMHIFLHEVKRHPVYLEIIPYSLLSLSLMGFFFLVIASSFLGGLAHFFAAEDLSLLLSAPVSRFRLFLTRITETALTSGWMFYLFALPALLAYTVALELSWMFFLKTFLLSIPFLLIPTALSCAVAMIFVNIIPANRITEFLALVCFSTGFALFFYGNKLPGFVDFNNQSLQKSIFYFSLVHDPHPNWLPSRWVAELIGTDLGRESPHLMLYVCLLLATTFGSLALCYLTFEVFFDRGLAMTVRYTKSPRIQHASRNPFFTTMLFAYSPQLRAMLGKELKMFIRDTTQSLQLLALLVLTMVYLYNFRSLRLVTLLNAEAYAWWQAILSLANIALGGCVIAAIATRFVYPSVSLEGRAYSLLRATPLSIHKLLWLKFFVWFIPLGSLTLLLIVSGALAIQVSPMTVALTSLIAISLAVGLVGMAVGIGALFANFDWDNPAQLSASFGSLLYMTLSFGVVLISLVPSTFIILLSCVPQLGAKMSEQTYFLALFCSLFLTFFINFAAANRAIQTGRQHLIELER